ncbi:MAG TPA: amidase [Terriglobales bacterium]|nr:amidase [Terriglobales bacterium]
MIGEEILYQSVTELGQQIREKKLSPVDLTKAYLERSEKLGPRLNAYATLTRDLALKQAGEAEKEIDAGKYRGPLHGIPYAAKDLLAVPGYPTTWGAKPFANQKFDFAARVIEKLNEAGAILIGKAAMIELAGGMGYRFASASATGPAKNPWNTGCWTCGSSSGSGAIVAGALAAFAIGTETWGSIICPSAFCGIAGLRPTFGRVSRYGAMALSYSMDKIGPMARSAEDCEIILQAISGYDRRDKGSLPNEQAQFAKTTTGNSRPLRLGVVKKPFGDFNPGADVKRQFDEAVAVMRRAGATVAEVELPEGPFETAAGVIISVEGAAAFRELIESGRISEINDPLGKVGAYVSTTIPGDDFLRAMQIRSVFQLKADDLFGNFDVITSPSLPMGASTLDTNLETGLSFPDPVGGLGNLCGLPAISVPCGFTDQKLPIGIQFVGRVLEDEKVLRAAKLFQQNTQWHKKHPPLGA